MVSKTSADRYRVGGNERIAIENYRKAEWIEQKKTIRKRCEQNEK